MYSLTTTVIKSFQRDLTHPLSLFRIIFGLLMTWALSRFWVNGWIEKLYIEPLFHFKYEYWTWVPTPTDTTLYCLFTLGILSALVITCGGFQKSWIFKISTWVFFICFSWIELTDKAYYLNHYYLISILALLLVIAPSQYFLNPKGQPWPLWFIRIQLSTLYFYAGIAKIHGDWVCEAQPLKIWLRSRAHYPILGPFLSLDSTAFLFSWAGLLFDLIAGFALLHNKTRAHFYPIVVAFHLMTAWLFPGIGLFPFFMILFTLVYFDWKIKPITSAIKVPIFKFFNANKFVGTLLVIWFAFQWTFPVRPYIYGGNYLWHEKGFRFGWRVMLMEKAGRIDYELQNANGQILWRPVLKEFLNDSQIKQLAFQSDMAVEFSHFLKIQYLNKMNELHPKQFSSTGHEIGVFAKCFVTLNGRISKLYWDPSLELTQFSPQSNIVAK